MDQILSWSKLTESILIYTSRKYFSCNIFPCTVIFSNANPNFFSLNSNSELL